MPDVFGVTRIFSDQCRDAVILKIGYNSFFTPVEGCISETVYTLISGNFHGNEVAARAADDYFCIGYFHSDYSLKPRTRTVTSDK